jgi:urease accessory protein
MTGVETGWLPRPRQASAAAFRLALIPIICHGFAAVETDIRVSIGMLRLESIVGLATDAALAERLHHLEHDGKVEYILLAGEDTARRRLHVADRPRHRLRHPAAAHRPVGERRRPAAGARPCDRRAPGEEAWLDLVPRDAAAAIELGYFAGNMHWPVRFEGDSAHRAAWTRAGIYRRLDHLLKDGRIRRADHE